MTRPGLWTATLAALTMAAGCATKAPPASPPPPTRIDETMRTLGAEGLRLEGATVVILLAPASVTCSRFYRRLTAALGDAPAAAPHEMLRDGIGVDLSTVEAVCFTVDPERNTFVLAAATREPSERAAWLDAMSRMREGGGSLERFDAHAGVDLYAPADDRAGAIAFPASRVVVAGSTPELRGAIDRVKPGTPVPYRPEIARLLGAAPRRADILVVAVPTRKLVAELTAAAAGPSFARIPEKAEGILLAATAGEALEVVLRMHMRSSRDAEEARAEASDALAGLAGQLGPAAGLAEVRPLVELVRDARVGGEGKTVEIAAKVPARALAPLVRLMTRTSE